MKNRILLLIALYAVGAFALNPEIVENRSHDPFGKITGNVGFISDYIFRGITQTDHQPALQGGMDWKHPSGIRLGAWGSNVSFPGSPASLELDGSVGYQYLFSNTVGASVSAVYYSYFRGGSGNMWEFPLELMSGPVKVGASYSPQWNGIGGPAWYLSAGWNNELLWGVIANLSVGYSIFDPIFEHENYADFRLVFSREFLTLNWELGGAITDRRQFEGADDPKVIAAVSKVF